MFYKVRPGLHDLLLVCLGVAFAAPFTAQIINYPLAIIDLRLFGTASTPFMIAYTGTGVTMGLLAWWLYILGPRKGILETLGWPTFGAGITTALFLPTVLFVGPNLDLTDPVQILQLLGTCLYFFLHGALASSIYLQLCAEKTK